MTYMILNIVHRLVARDVGCVYELSISQISSKENPFSFHVFLLLENNFKGKLCVREVLCLVNIQEFELER